MTNGKKKRMSMLDNLAAAGAPSPTPAKAPTTAPSMMSTNRALRSARDAVDGHNVWDLDPMMVTDDRISDRLDPSDVGDLRDAIEANGQTVPILVRRHPSEPDRYLLVYGRRRLEAIRTSDKVDKVRALVANLDENAALTAQISENMARRDLSFIEKALFAQELIETGFGNQSQVAEVLTVTKSSVSMALAVAQQVGAELIRAIGPAHGIGRPRWEALGKAIEAKGLNRDVLEGVASEAYSAADVAMVIEESAAETKDLSVAAFEAVERAAGMVEEPSRGARAQRPARRVKASQSIVIDGARAGVVKRTSKGVSIALEPGDFSAWVESQAQELIEELHARWLRRAED
ncbi:MAG: plasmid partitioning protein RepB [Maritimibacter sp.]